jgi:hypothetical protein
MVRADLPEHARFPAGVTEVALVLSQGLMARHPCGITGADAHSNWATPT